MDLFRRTARGELAEVLGAGPNNVAIDQDKLHRTYGFAQAAEAEVANASPQTRATLEAYARGVNAYASSLDPKSMPPEFQILQYSFRPWTPADSLVVVKIFAEALSDTWRLDVMRQAMSVLPPEKRAELLPETSAIDVLVVGKDTQPKVRSSAQMKPESVSPEALAKLAHNQEIAAAA
jgi:penicillin amidase